VTNQNDALVASPLVSDNLKEEVLRLRKANEALLREVQVRQKCFEFVFKKQTNKQTETCNYGRCLKTHLLLNSFVFRIML